MERNKFLRGVLAVTAPATMILAGLSIRDIINIVVIHPQTACKAEKVEGCTTSETLVNDVSSLIADALCTTVSAGIHTAAKISIRKQNEN